MPHGGADKVSACRILALCHIVVQIKCQHVGFLHCADCTPAFGASIVRKCVIWLSVRLAIHGELHQSLQHYYMSVVCRHWNNSLLCSWRFEIGGGRRKRWWLVLYLWASHNSSCSSDAIGNHSNGSLVYLIQDLDEACAAVSLLHLPCALA